MNTEEQLSETPKHLRITCPSPWVSRFFSIIPDKGHVLDLACGGGRHAKLLLENGYSVTAIDRDTSAISERLGSEENLTIIESDLECGIDPFSKDGPLETQSFDGIVVVNYLYRPLMQNLLGTLRPGGVLIYETFARGNEEYARPRNPDHLLQSGELLELVSGHLQIVAYEHGLVEIDDLPGVKQRLVATRDLDLSTRKDGDPPAHRI